MQLRPYQQEAVAAFFDYFTDGKGCPLIVLPTGAGKSLVIAGLCKEILTRWPDQRILVLSHVKELIQQNHDKIKDYWKYAPVGIYSASIGIRQPNKAIVVATVQSVYKKAEILGQRDIVLIDEAHLLSRKDTGMYLKLLNRLWEINPYIRLGGLTATAYRLDSGMLTEGDDAVFSDICYEAPLKKLIDAGYLSSLVGKAQRNHADMRKVGLLGGEFNPKQMASAFDMEAFTKAVLDEGLPLAEGRNSMLFFCASIEHAEHVRDALRERGINAETVTGTTPQEERDRLLGDFKAGRLHALTSVNVVSTGFDAPNVDCVWLLRATMSPGLYVQMVGRGLRLSPGKTNCMVLDYGQNIERHGALTHVQPPAAKRGRKKPGAPEEEAKVKICELCRSAWPLGTIECETCGNELVKERDPTSNLDTAASDKPILMSDEEYLDLTTQWVSVDSVSYRLHKKKDSFDSMRVEYYCGMMHYQEFVCPLHNGYAGRKALQWVEKRKTHPDASQFIYTSQLGLSTFIEEAARLLKQPTRIRVRKNGKYFEVFDYDFRPAHEIALAEGA